MVILDLEVLDTVLKEIVENIKHQKDAQRNSVQKEMLNSSPLLFSASLVKKTLIVITESSQYYPGSWKMLAHGRRAQGLLGPSATFLRKLIRGRRASGSAKCIQDCVGHRAVGPRALGAQGIPLIS